jgi:hypothetical protein
VLVQCRRMGAGAVSTVHLVDLATGVCTPGKCLPIQPIAAHVSLMGLAPNC